MSFAEAIRMAAQGVLANRMRSLLTMLGITIGVASVIVLVAVGHGSAAAVQSRIQGLGTNIVTIMNGGNTFGRRGPTQQSTGTSEPLIARMISRIEESSPPGVSIRTTIAGTPSFDALAIERFT